MAFVNRIRVAVFRRKGEIILKKGVYGYACHDASQRLNPSNWHHGANLKTPSN